MIWRTAEVLSKDLPPKTEQIVFSDAHRAILVLRTFKLALGSSDIALLLINVLKKVCNSPSLLKSSKDNDDTPSEMLQTLLPLIPANILNSSASSAKLRLGTTTGRIREASVRTLSSSFETLSFYSSSTCFMGALGSRGVRLDQPAVA
jgi:hypothetical protein